MRCEKKQMEKYTSQIERPSYIQIEKTEKNRIDHATASREEKQQQNKAAIKCTA